MKKIIICVSLFGLALVTSCQKDELVPEGEQPEWLGGSIYEELKNPKNLKGTFETYLRLADDLGYADVLSRTGSKTIFPANDSSFVCFFAPGGNEWGVTSYEQLSEAQKKYLFYNSMLDNAMLVNMLSNVSASTSTVMNGTSLKHETNASVIDTVTTMFRSAMPSYNKYFDRFRIGSLNCVRDATNPMMVHLTTQFILNNGLTTTDGTSGNDFKIITGQDYVASTEDNPTGYIFNNRITKGNVTCQNGYIHQVEDVLFAPGNMAQVLEKQSDTKYFSHILGYYEAPYYDATTTTNYNNWAKTNNRSAIDSIFSINYMSLRTAGSTLTSDTKLVTDPNGNSKVTSQVLKYDPGWNGYYPRVASPGSVDYSLADIGAIFVPDDNAFETYFVNGDGEKIMNVYCPDEKTTTDNLMAHLDSVQNQNPQILTAFINNLMQASFTSSVPSKFGTLTNDATDALGIGISDLKQKADGKYDIKICNNGVLYKINKVVAPAEYSAVLSVASLRKDMNLMNWAIQDRTYLGLDFKFYLLAMNANYALYLPNDDAFSNSNDCYYVDPTTYASSKPLCIRFVYDDSKNLSAAERIKYYIYYLNTDTKNSVTDDDPDGPYSLADVSTKYYKKVLSLWKDILNTHTVLLSSGERAGDGNSFYMSKAGAGLRMEGSGDGAVVYSGSQYKYPCSQGLKYVLPGAKVIKAESSTNGCSYRMDGVIQPTMDCVYDVLSNTRNFYADDRFTLFKQYCDLLGSSEILTWVGLSADKDVTTGVSPQDYFKIFVDNNGLNSSVRFFNTYNYTVYAPNDEAVKEAIENGLPTYESIMALFNATYTDETKKNAAKDKVLLSLEAIRKFVRYHFQNNSIFADQTITSGSNVDYNSTLSDNVGLSKKIRVKKESGGGILKISDVAGNEVSINANNTSRLSNIMLREYVFDSDKTKANTIETSSYAVLHEINKPLYYTIQNTFKDRIDDASAANLKEHLADYKNL